MPRSLPAAAALALLTIPLPSLPAQADAPPWWGVPDDDTVSLYWSFDNALAPFVPTQQVLPSWYVFPPNSGFTTTPNVAWLPGLNGQTGVIGFQGAGSGLISLVIDNDPRYDWIKIFWFQFDALATGGADVVGAIRQDLARYRRAIVSETSVPLANGWVRTTIGAYLIPQPIDEALDFALTGAALGSAAIDNLFVNSKCVKPPPDETGDALGEVDLTLGNFDLNQRTGNADCTAVAATEDQTGAIRYFVAGVGASPGLSHEIYALNANGTLGVTVATNVTSAQSPRGITDFAVARLRNPGLPATTVVYGVMDRRSPLGGGDVLLLALDPTTPTLVPARSISIPQAQFPASAASPFGLAFFPPGDGGNGTFWISEQGGSVFEVSRAGALLRTLTPSANGTPPGIGGATYDELTGRFYWFSSAPSPTPGGPLQVVGHEHSAYDFQPTGTVFYGDLNLPGPTPGGIARGMEILRRRNGDFRLLCVTRNGPVSRLSVLKGPFAFGWNLLGRIRMAGDPPVQGAPNFRIGLDGVARGTAAVLYAGFSNRAYQGQALPFNLAFLGLDESSISVGLNLSGPVSVLQGGSTQTVIPLPPSGLRYVPLFFQWVVFDATAPNGLATSQAGKTVLY